MDKFGIDNIINTILEKIINEINANSYFGIRFSVHSGRDMEYADIFYEKIDNALVYFYKTLIKNYEKGNIKADKENKYKLSISDRVYHIETDNDDNTENNQWQNNLTQNLGVDITGNHCMINIGLGL